MSALNSDYVDKGFASTKSQVAAFNVAWYEAWQPGEHLVINETMLCWGGLGALHVTWMLRKPTPIGICMKTGVCGDSHVLLIAKLVEGKLVDSYKDYVG